MQGWIKIHRKLMDWEWYQDGNTCRLFIHLLLKANHKPKKWQGVLIGVGQLVTGRGQLSSELGLSEQQIRTSMGKLKSTSNITSKSTNRFTVITLCNYKDFQQIEEGDQPTNQPATQPTNNQQITTNKNDKKEKKEKTPLTPPRGKFKIPDDLDSEIWNGFEEMRKKIKCPMTDKARSMIIQKLNKINQDTGACKNEIIEQSILNSWRSVFELKDDKASQSNKNIDQSKKIAQRAFDFYREIDLLDKKFENSNLIFLKALNRNYSESQIIDVLEEVASSPPNFKLKHWGLLNQYFS